MEDLNGQEFMGSSGQKPTARRGRLQVSKVGPSFNWQAFQTHLESYGQILKTTSQTDDDDQSLLTCFVEFTDSNNARRAADDLNGIDFDGSRLELAYIEDDSQPVYEDTTKQRNRQAGRNRQRWQNRQNNNANMPLRILIPSDMVGAVIGKGGETVRKMSNNTNARIDVHRTVNINGFKPVTITGQTDKPAENCSAAFREIHQKLIEEVEKKADGDERTSVPMRMLAPDLLMGRVIGKAGRNLKEIKVKTGTKIDATRDPVTPVFNERIITIEDPSLENPVEKCSNAEEEISRILRKSYQDDLSNMANVNGRMAQNAMGPFSNPYLMAMIASLTGGRGFNGMPPPFMGNGMNPGGYMSAGMHSQSTHGAAGQKIEKIHVAVPKNAVGAIIGREGCVVNGIRHASGASVQVLNSDEDAVETLVELRGYPHQLTMAEGAIFQKIQEQGFAGHPNQTVQLRTEIKIPPEAVGRIIGRRGTKVRSLQGRHRALVEVPRSVNPDETEVVVRVLSDYVGSQGVQTEIREIVAQVEAQQRK